MERFSPFTISRHPPWCGNTINLPWLTWDAADDRWGWRFGTWLDYDCPFSLECHHPKWRTPSFFKGVGIPPATPQIAVLELFQTQFLWLEIPFVQGRRCVELGMCSFFWFPLKFNMQGQTPCAVSKSAFCANRNFFSLAQNPMFYTCLVFSQAYLLIIKQCAMQKNHHVSSVNHPLMRYW